MQRRAGRSARMPRARKRALNTLDVIPPWRLRRVSRSRAPRREGGDFTGRPERIEHVSSFFAPLYIVCKVCAMLLQPHEGLRPRWGSALPTIMRLTGVALCLCSLVLMDTMRPVQAFAVVRPLVSALHSSLHGGQPHLLRHRPSYPSTKFSLYNNKIGILNRRTRLCAFEDGLGDSYRNSSLSRFESDRQQQRESRSLINFLDDAEKRMELVEKKFTAKADKKLHKLRRKLARRLEQMEGTLDRVRPGIKRIASSPKLMALALATCLVAVPASTMAFSLAATVFQVPGASFDLMPIPIHSQKVPTGSFTASPFLPFA